MIDDLIEIIVPPLEPVYSGSMEDFRRFEVSQNISFPTDFKEIITRYGSGTFGSLINLINPFQGRNGESEYVVVEQQIRLNYFDMRSDFPEYNPFEYYPKQYGILPWGTSQNGDELFWYIVDTNPENWQVIIWQSRSQNYWLYPFNLTTFLAGIFTNKVFCPAFGYMADRQAFVKANIRI